MEGVEAAVVVTAAREAIGVAEDLEAKEAEEIVQTPEMEEGK